MKKNETVTIKAMPMENLEFESSLTIGEIEENFQSVDCFSGIMEGLQEALAHSRKKTAVDEQPTKVSIFHKITDITPLPDHQLRVQFVEGCIKTYDMRPLFERIPSFAALKDYHLFSGVTVGVGGYGVVWNDDLDLSGDELWENGADE